MGVLWNFKRENFGFEVTLKQKPMIQKELLLLIILYINDSLDIVPSYCSTIYSFRKTIESGIMQNKRAQGSNSIRENPDTVEKIGKKIKIVEETSSWKFSNFGTIVECSLHHLRTVVSMAMDKYCTCS